MAHRLAPCLHHVCPAHAPEHHGLGASARVSKAPSALGELARTADFVGVRSAGFVGAHHVGFSSSSSSIYQIPNTEHMAYRLVRTLVYKRGVGIRETVVVIKCGMGW